MAYRHPGEEFVLQHGRITNREFVLQYADFLRKEAGAEPIPPIDLEKIYAQFGMPTPKRARLPNQQGLLLSPEMGLILVNETDPMTRQRFTEAHELFELLFDTLPSGTIDPHRKGPFSHGAKEKLCNEGAAELLMPAKYFANQAKVYGVSIALAQKLSKIANVSLTAALVQLSRVGPGHHAVVLWRMKNKKSDTNSAYSKNQIPLFNMPPKIQPPKKLRVEWSLRGPKSPYIPNNKSIPEDCSIYSAWRDGKYASDIDYLDLGSKRGMFKCESLPFEAGGERSVLSLIEF